MYNSIIRTVHSLLIIAFLGGCANLMFEPYGYVSQDRVSLSPEIKKASLPAIAPTISQGYKPETEMAPFQGTHESRRQDIHEGIDIIANVGFPVLAAADGVISKAYYEPLYGNRLVVDHGEIEDGRYVLSRYFHLDERLVKVGDVVKRGQQIATMGRTGILSGGFAHLHFEVRYRNKPEQRLTTPVNTHAYWFNGLGQVTCYDKSKDYTGYVFKITYPVPCLGMEWQ